MPTWSDADRTLTENAYLFGDLPKTFAYAPVTSSAPVKEFSFENVDILSGTRQSVSVSVILPNLQYPWDSTRNHKIVSLAADGQECIALLLTSRGEFVLVTTDDFLLLSETDSRKFALLVLGFGRRCILQDRTPGQMVRPWDLRDLTVMHRDSTNFEYPVGITHIFPEDAPSVAVGAYTSTFRPPPAVDTERLERIQTLAKDFRKQMQDGVKHPNAPRYTSF